MTGLIVILLMVLVVATVSVSHALGMWLVVMIAHGFLVKIFGPAAIHLPLYSGLIILGAIIIKKQWRMKRQDSLLLFGVLIIMMLVSAVQGLDPSRSVGIVMLYVKVFMLALLIGGTLRTEKDIKLLSIYCIAGTVFGAFIAVYQYKTGAFALQNIYVERAAGLNADPNDTAMLLLAGLPLSVYWSFSSKKLVMKSVFLFCVVMLLIGLVLTGSRGGFVSLVLISMLFYFKKPSIKATVIGVALLAVAVVLAPQSYKTRINTLVTGEEEHGKSLDSRGTLLKKGVTAFLNDPVLGVGAGNYGAAFKMAEGKETLVGGGASIGKSAHFTAHNMYLEFFVENGFLGGMLLLAVFYSSLSKIFKYERRRAGVVDRFSFGYSAFLALMSMLFSCLFLSQAKSPVLWFLVGIGLAVANVTVKNGPSDKADDDKENKEDKICSNGVVLKRKSKIIVHKSSA